MASSCSTRADWKKLSGTFRLLLRTSPITASPIFILAVSCFIKARTNEAIDHFQQTLGPEEDDSTPGYFYALGAAYARAEIVRVRYTISVKRSSELPRWARENCSEVLKGI